MNWIEFRNKTVWKHVIVIGKHYVKFFGKLDEDDSKEHELFEIAKEGYKYLNISDLEEDDQKEIKKFLNQNPKNWFSGVNIKNKYILVIGTTPKFRNSYVMYAKSNLGFTTFENCSLKTDAFDSRFQFTQKEIDQLKEQLPNKNLRIIVDFSKQIMDTTIYESWIGDIE